jgi:histidinol-phosphate phosphatase family protein
MSVQEMRPALFVDRDGTLITDVGYIKDPADVELIPDSANAIRRMNDARWPVIVVTNQSGIARGMLTIEDYEAVRGRLDHKLAERGAHIDAHYYCPHHPDFSGPCACRKPATQLYDRASADHAVNPSDSVFVGDRWRDVAPALHYGARGILVPGPHTPPEEIALAREQAAVARTLAEAVHRILQT